VIEAGWGVHDTFRQGHIPGADYLDTGELESESLWNVVAPEALRNVLAAHGIRCDTTVILYSRTPLAATRVAHILLYAGYRMCVCWTEAGEHGFALVFRWHPAMRYPSRPLVILAHRSLLSLN
jgi:hypothetical protein